MGLHAVYLQIYQKKTTSDFLFQEYLSILVILAQILWWFLKPVDKFPKNYMWKNLYYGKVGVSFYRATILNPLLKSIKILVKNTLQ